MSIKRHEIRQISDENRGQPIISQAVVHGNVAYFAGITPNPIVGDIKTQTAQVLRRVDELLNLAGTDKSQLLSAQVWIADMRLFEDHNYVWNEWVDPANPPARACLTTDFWRPGMLVEVMVVAAVHEPLQSADQSAHVMPGCVPDRDPSACRLPAFDQQTTGTADAAPASWF